MQSQPKPPPGLSRRAEGPVLGNFASQYFDIRLRNFCGSLRRLSFSTIKRPTSIAEICGDDESAQKLRREIYKSWLVKFPRPVGEEHARCA